MKRRREPLKQQRWGTFVFTSQTRQTDCCASSLTDLPSPQPTHGWDVDLSRSSVDKKVKVSSVHPIQSSPPLPSTKGSTHGRTGKPSQQAFRPNLMPQFHVCFTNRIGLLAEMLKKPSVSAPVCPSNATAVI